MRKQLAVSLGLVLGLMGTTPGFAVESSTEQMTEAKLFFSQVLNKTNNPIIANLAQENLSKLQGKTPAAAASRQQVEVPLMTQLGNSLAVPVLIDKKVMATFLVDTGATYTVITPRLAKKLGVKITPDSPKMTIITANGPINAPLVTLDTLSIGGVEVRNVQVIVQDLGPDVLLAGLLGMNFFKEMDLTIKPDRLILGISKASL